MSSNNDVINVFNKIFARAKNHGKRFPELSQTSFCGIVYSVLSIRWVLRLYMSSSFQLSYFCFCNTLVALRNLKNTVE